MERSDVEGVINLQAFIFRFREVKRRVRVPSSEEWENDVDHSFGLAMTAWFVASNHYPQLNQAKLFRYALVHDLVETYAGDTFAFDEESKKDKHAREQDALDKMITEFSEFPELLHSIVDYEQRVDDESKFIYALDKLMPAFVSCLDNGRVWQDEKITYPEVLAIDIQKVSVSPEVVPLFEELHSLLKEHPEYFYQPE